MLIARANERISILDQKDLYECPECGSKYIRTDYYRGEIACGECGLVLTENILDRGPEWRAFTLEEEKLKRRVGLPSSFLIYDKNLGSRIGRRSYLKNEREIIKLIYAERMARRKERRLSRALSLLLRWGYSLNLPRPITEEASRMYRKMRKERGRGIHRKRLVGACLLYAAKLNNLPLTLKEIATAQNTEEKPIRSEYRTLLERFNVKPPPPPYEKYISKFSNLLNLRATTEQLAHKIMEKARESKITLGKSPLGVAGASLYIACKLTGEKKSKKKVAFVANVTTVTLGNRVKQFMKELDFIIPV